MTELKIKLTHKYSELEKEHQFGLEFENDENYKVYIRWIYFFMGKYLGLCNVTIYPYKIGKTVYNYKYCNNAIRQAKMIVKKIKKIRND